MFIQTKQQITIILILTILFLLSNQQAHAALYINEIFPAPVSPNLEWVELYNDEDVVVDLANYTLVDDSNKKLTFSSATIPANGFMVITSINILNNSGDTVMLKNGENTTVDTIVYPSISSNNSYVKCASDWYVVSTSTQDALNTNCPTPTPTPIPPTTTLSPSYSPTPTPTPTPPQSYNNIYISEVMVAPETSEKEWIEFYNDNEYDVTLTDWFIDDIEGSGSAPKKISVSIGPKQYAVIEISSAIFNNSGDSVRLLDFEENEKDVFSYKSSEKGNTWGWIEIKGKKFCLQSPSKNKTNTACLQDQTSDILDSVDKETPSSKTEVSTSMSQAGQPPISSTRYTSYAIAVTPPIIIPQSNVTHQEIRGVTTTAYGSKQVPSTLPLLAASYSLLSIGSLVIKMIYS